MNCTTKSCKDCKLEKPLDDFYFIKRRNTFDTRCKPCSTINKKKYYNRDKHLASSKKYAKDNKEKVEEYQKKYRKIHDEEFRKYRKEYNQDPENKKRQALNKKLYYQENKTSLDKKKKEWYHKNKERCLEKSRKNARERLKNNKNNFRTASYLRNRIKLLLKGKIKSKTTKELLGCSFEQFRSYISMRFLPGMTWENHGKDGWHLDHIIPCKAFSLEFTEHQQMAFHYTNFQPLWETDNLKKGDSFELNGQVIDSRYDKDKINNADLKELWILNKQKALSLYPI